MWRASTDAAIATLLLGLISVAVFFVPREAVMLGVPGLNEAVFVTVPTLLSLWVGLRLWILARFDAGPSNLLFIGFLASLLYAGYSVASRGELPQGSPDAFALAVRWIGGAIGAIALLRWRRIPSWIGWICIAIIAVEVTEVIAQDYTGRVLVTATWLMDTVATFGLAFALFRNPLRVVDDSAVHLTSVST